MEIIDPVTTLQRKIARREAQKKYNTSEKGKATKRQYNFFRNPSLLLDDPVVHISDRTQRLIGIFQRELLQIQFNLQRLQSQKVVTEKIGMSRAKPIRFAAHRLELLKYQAKIEQVLEILR
jgi:hypothetical protein